MGVLSELHEIGHMVDTKWAAVIEAAGYIPDLEEIEEWVMESGTCITIVCESVTEPDGHCDGSGDCAGVHHPSWLLVLGLI